MKMPKCFDALFGLRFAVSILLAPLRLYTLREQ